VSAARRTPAEAEANYRVFNTPQTRSPEVHLLSNGRYHVAVTAAGGGYSRWRDVAVTRWREDPTRDCWGTFCYLRDVETGEFWSTAHQPTLRRAASYEAIYSQGRAEFRRQDDEIDTHVEIAVSPEDDIELRRISLTNRGKSGERSSSPVTPRSRSRRRPRTHRTRRSATCSSRRSSIASGRRSCARADPDPARSGRLG
jgi:cellobiose phosphorylase